MQIYWKSSNNYGNMIYFLISLAPDLEKLDTEETTLEKSLRPNFLDFKCFSFIQKFNVYD